MTQLAVRPERRGDHAAIRRLLKEAFGLPASSYRPDVRGLVTYPPAFDDVT